MSKLRTDMKVKLAADAIQHSAGAKTEAMLEQLDQAQQNALAMELEARGLDELITWRIEIDEAYTAPPVEVDAVEPGPVEAPEPVVDVGELLRQRYQAPPVELVVDQAQPSRAGATVALLALVVAAVTLAAWLLVNVGAHNYHP